MGKKAVFERTRQRQVRQSREQRARKSAAARATRRGETDATRRLIQRSAPSRAPITDAQRDMLLRQFAQACRLPSACEDLCALLLQEQKQQQGDGAGATAKGKPHSSRKRTRDAEADPVVHGGVIDSMATALLELEGQAAATDEASAEEPLTLLEDVLQDECGSRAVCAILAAAATTQSAKVAEVCDVVAKLFEESDTLHEHFIACRVLSALVRHGDDKTRMRALRILQHHASNATDMEAQLRNRHCAVTIRYLLEHCPAETAAWVCTALGLNTRTKGKSSPKRPAKTRSGGKGENENNDEAEDDGNNNNGNKNNNKDTHALLASLMLDPVAAPVMRALLHHPSARTALLQSINVSALLETRRGCKFVQESLSTELHQWTPEEAILALDAVLAVCGSRLVDMCTSRDGNFVVQSILRLTPLTDVEAATVRLKSLLRELGPHLSSFALHSIGVHVVMALITALLELPTRTLAEEAAGILLTRHNVAEWLRDASGSLVVRRLLPLCAARESKSGQLLASAVEQEMGVLTYDAVGNLVVQEFLKVRGGEELARKLVKSDELPRMCQHAYASHVVGCLLDHVNATIHMGLCSALRPHALELAKHLNGRFVIEKAIQANRDMRDLLLRHFTTLATEKGTQHVLSALVANLDPRGKKQVLDMILAQLVEFASHQCSSIVLQKLMQSDAAILKAVHEELIQKPRLRNELAQNFFGKFVVQISEASEVSHNE